MLCNECEKRDSCKEVCRDVEIYLRRFGIHDADWMGPKYIIPKDIVPTTEGDVMRCPICNRVVSYYRARTKEYVCGRCPWTGTKEEAKTEKEKDTETTTSKRK